MFKTAAVSVVNLINPVSGYRTNCRGIASSTGYCGKSPIKRMLEPPRPDFDSTWDTECGDAERFRRKADRRGLTEQDMANLEWSTAFQFGLFFIFGLAALAYAIGTRTLYPGGFFFLFLALTINSGLSNWRIRTRRFGPLSEYLSNRGLWVPWLALFLAVLPGASIAAGMTSDAAFSPVAALQAMVVNETGTTPTTAIGAAMLVFLTALTSVATFLLAGNIILGTISTAYEGKVLGQRWHQWYAPLRTTVGVASLVPACKGFCLAQVLVFELAMMSMHLGSQIATEWIRFQTQALGPGTVAAAGPGLPTPLGGLEFLHQVLQTEVCAAWYATAAEKGGNQRLGWLLGDDEGDMVPPLPPAAGLRIGNTYVWDYKHCGSFSVATTSADTAGGDPHTGEATPATPTTPDVQAAITYANASRAAVEHLVTSLRSSGMATRIAQGYHPGGEQFPGKIAAPIAPIATTYDNEMMAAAKTFANSGSSGDLRQRLGYPDGPDGLIPWEGLGLWAMPLIQLGNQISDLASSPPTWRAPTTRDVIWQGSISRDGAKLIDLVNLKWSLETKFATGMPSAQDLAAAGDMTSDAVTAFVGPMLRKVLNNMTMYFAATADPQRALTECVSFGDSMITVGVGMTVAAVAGAVATGNVIGSAGGAKDGYWLLMIFVIPIIAGCLAIGLTWAVWIPMQPILNMMYVVIGYEIFLTEVEVTVPLAAVMWVRFDGNEFVDAPQQYGINVAFNLLLRPPLAVLGFCMSFVLLPISISFVDWVFCYSMYSIQGGHVGGIIKSMGFMSVFTVVQANVVTLICSLCWRVPNFAAKMMGIGEHAQGEAGLVEQTTKESEQSTQGATGIIRTASDKYEHRSMGASKLPQPPTSST